MSHHIHPTPPSQVWNSYYLGRTRRKKDQLLSFLLSVCDGLKKFISNQRKLELMGTRDLGSRRHFGVPFFDMKKVNVD